MLRLQTVRILRRDFCAVSGPVLPRTGPFFMVSQDVMCLIVAIRRVLVVSELI
ncbi:hypothetical protein LMG24238_00968 [Paraburkholderia sediminicola]|uniref:Uncharacterized protein n=1 Tax=Paraburkholderia sediminicola TaxID=458836 RepID=A0A6J5A7X8_9BURK|nr:hypothetical protein LMG24238_00968 [Paraburkholderia sediminicola]